MCAPLACAADLAVLDQCLARLDAQVDIGYDRVAARCPELSASLESSPWSAWLPRQWREPSNDLSAAGLRELRDLAVQESLRLPLRPSVHTGTLQPILAQLGALQPRRMSAWVRVKAWLRSLLPSGAAADSQGGLRSWVARVGVSQAALKLVAAAALAATVVLAAVIVLLELRAAGLLRIRRLRRRRSRQPRAARSEAAGTSAHPDVAAVTERPRLLLELVAARLTRAGLLPAAAALTVREFVRAAAGLPAEDRARLSDLAAACERVRYSGQPVPTPYLEQALKRGQELLSRLEAPRG